MKNFQFARSKIEFNSKLKNQNPNTKKGGTAFNLKGRLDPSDLVKVSVFFFKFIMLVHKKKKAVLVKFFGS